LWVFWLFPALRKLYYALRGVNFMEISQEALYIFLKQKETNRNHVCPN